MARTAALTLARAVRRKPSEAIFAEGLQPVREALAARAHVFAVIVTESAAEQFGGVLELATDRGIPVEVVSARDMELVAATRAPQGIAALVANPARSLIDIVSERPRRVLVLTDVRDPGNVGTALRAAEGAGFEAALVCARACDPGNDKAVRASAGAVFHLPYAANVDATEALSALASWCRIGARHDATSSVFERPPSEGPIAIAVGNEAWGFTPEVMRLLDEIVSIPMRGRVTSLNAGVAAGILCYELRL